MLHRRSLYPHRIVSLEPSVTATLIALGRQDRLIAVSKHDTRLLGEELLQDLPRVPCTWSVKPEDLLPLQPDLVIASVPMREESVSALLRAGLNTLILQPKHLDSVYDNIRLLAALTDARERGEQIVTEMESTFARLWEQSADKPHYRVYMEVWPHPLMNGPAWHEDIIRLLGSEFVPAGPDRKLSEEEIFAADPEAIVVVWPGVDAPPLEKVYTRPGWERVTAIREKRVLHVPEIWLNAPGPNLAHGAELLARALWGEETAAD